MPRGEPAATIASRIHVLRRHHEEELQIERKRDGRAATSTPRCNKYFLRRSKSYMCTPANKMVSMRPRGICFGGVDFARLGSGVVTLPSSKVAVVINRVLGGVGAFMHPPLPLSTRLASITLSVFTVRDFNRNLRKSGKVFQPAIISKGRRARLFYVFVVFGLQLNR